MTTPRALAIAEQVEAFVREVVFPYERDPRRDSHNAPLDAMVRMKRPKNSKPRVALWVMMRRL